MAWRIVKQPNGLLARFSDVVDDFTDYDMTYQEAVELCIQHGMPTVSARDKTWRGLVDEPIPGYVKRTADDGLDRWRQAIAEIRAVHGDAAAEERIRELSKQP